MADGRVKVSNVVAFALRAVAQFVRSPWTMLRWIPALIRNVASRARQPTFPAAFKDRWRLNSRKPFHSTFLSVLQWRVALWGAACQWRGGD
jgi:hypothetical protein